MAEVVGSLSKISDFTVSGNTIGREVIITVPAMPNRPTYTFELEYVCGSASGSIVEKTSYQGDGVWEWVPPLSLAEQVPNANSVGISITCTAYAANGAKANSTTKNLAFKLEMGLVRPVILKHEAFDMNKKTLALTGDSHRFVNGHSEAATTLKASTLYGATVVRAWITHGGGYTDCAIPAGSTEFNRGVSFEKTRGAKFEYSVKDSRGYTTSVIVSHTEVPYTKPTVAVSPDIPQPDGSMAFKVAGAWFGQSFGAVDNALALYFRIKTGDGEFGAWQQMDAANIATTETSYEAQLSVIVDYSQKVTIQAKASDLLSEAESEEKAVRAFPVFYWGENDFLFNVPVHIKGGLYFDEVEKAIYAVTESGEYHNVFQGRNKNGHTIIGWDNYANADGNTSMYGNDVKIGVANVATPTVYTPYIRQGNVVTVNINTAGVCTNNKADVIFMVPFSKPIIGSPTVAASSPNNGFILRQGGSYTHGSGVSKFVKPSSYEAVVRPNHGVHIVASFDTLTNAANNAPIGVYWSGTLTFS